MSVLARDEVMLPSERMCRAPEDRSSKAARVVAGLPCPVPGVHDFGIDAVTGESDPEKEFRQNQDVRIVVRDVNPFLFQYEVQVNDVPLTEPSPAEFFGNVPFGLQLPKSGAGKSPTTTAPGAAGAVELAITFDAADPDCDGDVAKEKVEAARRDVSRVGQHLQRAYEFDRRIGDTVLVTVQQRGERADHQFAQHRATLLDARQRAPTVRDAAERATQLLAAYSDTVGQGVGRVNADMLTLSLELNDLSVINTPLSKLHAKCHFFTDTVLDRARLIVQDTVRYRAAVEALRARRGEMRSIAQLLRMTSQNPQRFYVVRRLDRYTAPTDVKIAVSRKAVPPVDDLGAISTGSATQPSVAATSGTSYSAAAAKPGAHGDGKSTTDKLTEGSSAKGEPKTDSGTKASSGSASTQGSAEAEYQVISQPRLNFGGLPRFLIGAGVTWSDLATREYSTIRRFQTPASGSPGDTIGAFVAPPSESFNRIVPMLTLSTRLINIPPVAWVDGIHVTLGAGPTTTGRTHIEYLVGGGISALDQRVLLTLGAYMGETQRLGGGLRVGDRLADPSIPPPVQTRMAVRFGAGLTYRLVPFGSSAGQQ